MVGLDKNRIARTFDLKGSTHGRIEQVDNVKFQKGQTGLQCLKDLNLLELTNDQGKTNYMDID